VQKRKSLALSGNRTPIPHPSIMQPSQQSVPNPQQCVPLRYCFGVTLSFLCLKQMYLIPDNEVSHLHLVPHLTNIFLFRNRFVCGLFNYANSFKTVHRRGRMYYILYIPNVLVIFSFLGLHDTEYTWYVGH
jgi:hypothetical protein